MNDVNVKDLMGEVPFKTVSRYERETAEYEKSLRGQEFYEMTKPDYPARDDEFVRVERTSIGWFLGNKRGIDKLRQGA